jgi:hypothetical protein
VTVDASVVGVATVDSAASEAAVVASLDAVESLPQAASAIAATATSQCRRAR